MKRLLFFSFLLSAFYACKKEEHEETLTPVTPVDYRDAVVGNYIGTKNNHTWIMGMPPNEFDTTYAWTFTIIKDSTSDSTIIADGYSFKVDSNLYFTEGLLPGPNTRTFSFSNDTAIIYFRSGGLGGYSSTTITGIKQ
ncbi:MAG: hypothetical protein U0Y08_09865 [Bacteroidia bacterium]